MRRVLWRRERERNKYFSALLGKTVFKRTQKSREARFVKRWKSISRGKRPNEIESYHSTPKCTRLYFVERLSNCAVTFDVICSNDLQNLSSSLCLSLLSSLWIERRMHLLGMGTFGKVFFASYCSTRFVVKFCAKRNVGETCEAMGEQNCVELCHTNIVRTYCLVDVNTSDLKNADRLWIYNLLSHQLSRLQSNCVQIILMEFVGKQSLYELINDKSQEINDSLRINFCLQITSALSYCHRNSLIHLDLKPSNIVITCDRTCKLVDFGCSKKVKPNESNNRFEHMSHSKHAFGTVAYTAPEIFRSVEPTEKCDIYSFGIIMWQLMARENPYSNLSIDYPQTIIYKVVAENLRPNFPDEAMIEYAKYCKLAESCWNVSPLQRPSAAILSQQFHLSCSGAGHHSILG